MTATVITGSDHSHPQDQATLQLQGVQDSQSKPGQVFYNNHCVK